MDNQKKGEYESSAARQKTQLALALISTAARQKARTISIAEGENIMTLFKVANRL